MAHDVFISYAKEDRHTANSICEHLESQGIQCWIDWRDIPPGLDWDIAIEQAVGASRLLVLVFSSNADNSPHVKRELHAAVNRNIRLLPIRIENVMPSQIGYLIRTVQWREAWTPPFAEHLPAIYVDVKKWLEGFGVEEHAARSSADFHAHLRHYAQNMIEAEHLPHSDDLDLEMKARCGTLTSPLATLLQTHSRLVITGSPGSSKTTFMRKTLKALCRELLARLERQSENGPPLLIPVYVELGLLTPSGGRRSIAELIVDQLGLIAPHDPAAALKTLVDKPNVRLIFLLDGLNELGEEHRQSCVNELFALDRALIARGRRESLRIAVSSRSYGFINYFESAGYALADILPLGPDEIRRELRRNLPLMSADGDDLFDRLEPKFRQLLSSPQHLHYFIRWCRDKHAGLAREESIRSRGELLGYMVDDKLKQSKIPDERRHLVHAVLDQIAYRTANAGVFFPYASEDGAGGATAANSLDVLGTTVDTLNRLHSSLQPDALLKEVFQSGLIVRRGDLCKFEHHSFQQYFASRQMARLWRLDEYINSSLWHEPLIIMAGSLGPERRRELLAKVRPHRRLYAYVLANLNEPELEEQFLNETAEQFIARTRRWAFRLAYMLTALFGVWFILLPVLAFVLTVAPAGRSHLPFVLLGVGYLFVLPALLILHFKWQFRRKLERLSRQELPDTVVALRFLLARGAMLRVRADLNRLRGKMSHDKDDPRPSFVSAAIEQIDSSMVNLSYRTEDEKLARLDDVMAAIEVDVKDLTPEQIELLCVKAQATGDDASGLNALDILRRLYLEIPDSRERTAGVFKGIAAGRGPDGKFYSRRRQQRAEEICLELGLEPQLAPRPRLRVIVVLSVITFGALLLWLVIAFWMRRPR